MNVGVKIGELQLSDWALLWFFADRTRNVLHCMTWRRHA